MFRIETVQFSAEGHALRLPESRTYDTLRQAHAALECRWADDVVPLRTGGGRVALHDTTNDTVLTCTVIAL